MSNEIDDYEKQLRRRRLVTRTIAVAVLLTLGATGGVLAWRSYRAPEPLRVLIAVGVDGQWWEGSAASSALTDSLATQLEGVGFEPVRGGDPNVERVLKKAKTLEDASRSLHAAFVISGDIAPEAIKLPVDGGFTELHGHGTVTVKHLADKTSESFNVTTWSGARKDEEAQRLLGVSLAPMIFAEGLPKLVSHPSVQELFKGPDVKLLERTTAARTYTTRRAAELDEGKKNYEQLAEAHSKNDESPTKIKWVTPWTDESLIGGTGEQGVLSRIRRQTLIVSPRTYDRVGQTQLDSLAWLGADGTPREIWTGYNLYGYPSSSTDGKIAVFVEDLYGWAKSLTVASNGQPSKRVLIDANHRFEQVRASSRGGYAALYDRPCKPCAPNFLIVSTMDGKKVHERIATSGHQGDIASESYGGVAWIDEARLLLVIVPNDEDNNSNNERIELVDLEKSTTTRWMTLRKGERARTPIVSRDGRTVAFERSGEHGVGLFVAPLDAPSSGKMLIDGVVSFPDLSPDGTSVVFGRDGDVYIAALPSGEIRPATRTPFEERYPRFSGDGKSICFECVDRDPALRNRQVAAIGCVPII